MSKIEYGVRVAIKLSEGVLAGDIQFLDGSHPTSLAEAEQKAREIANNFGDIGGLSLILAENRDVFLILSKDLLSRHPVFISAVSRDVDESY